MLSENFCRNPFTDSADTIWCYTTDPVTKWDYCDLMNDFCELLVDTDDHKEGTSVSTKDFYHSPPQTDGASSKYMKETNKLCLDSSNNELTDDATPTTELGGKDACATLCEASLTCELFLFN